MKKFKIGEPIRFGVKEGGIFVTSKDDFEIYYSTLLEPTKEIKIEGEWIDDNPFYWSPIFMIFTEGKYIVHIKNSLTGLNIKETFEVINELYEANDSDILI